MELRDALSQIAEIRQQMARAQVFRGYRAATAAFSAASALLAGAVQPYIASDPQRHPKAYVLLWAGVALLNLLAVAVEMTVRYRRSQSQLHRDTTLAAAEHFIPAVVAGATVTLVLWSFAPTTLWMLPGLWCILFSMGIFASRRMLPAATVYVAMFYLLAGLVNLAVAQGSNAFSPLAMGLPFGLGQILAAVVLYWNLERRNASDES